MDYFNHTLQDLADDDLLTQLSKEILLSNQETSRYKHIFSPVDRMKPEKSEKYRLMLDIFFTFSQLKSIEKKSDGFTLVFSNQEEKEISCIEAAELINSSVESIKAIPEELRFDLDELYSFIEEPVKEKLEKSKQSIEEYIQPLRNYVGLRRLFTYSTDRLQVDNKVEYAELTPSGYILPNWFIRFKLDIFHKLTRKEQVVAFLNKYEDRYEAAIRSNPLVFNYIYEIDVSEADIQAHRFNNYYRKSK